MAVSVECLGQALEQLAVLFGHQNGFLTAQRLDQYHRALWGINDQTFLDALDQVAQREMTFPVPATILKYVDQARAKAVDERYSEEELKERQDRNLARIQQGGLHSDRLIAEARAEGIVPFVQRPGSNQHRLGMRMYDQLVRGLERSLTERIQEERARPGIPVFMRRAEYLEEALSEAYRAREHYEETGESIEQLPLQRTVPIEEDELYFCLRCGATDDSPVRAVRVDVAYNTPYFSVAIPCPECQPIQYHQFVVEHGVPPGMPGMQAALNASARAVQREAQRGGAAYH